MRVIQGSVFDVAVDVRREAQPSAGGCIELSAANHRQLWIPAGLAHGFLVNTTQPTSLQDDPITTNPLGARAALGRSGFGIALARYGEPPAVPKDAQARCSNESARLTPPARRSISGLWRRRCRPRPARGAVAGADRFQKLSDELVLLDIGADGPGRSTRPGTANVGICPVSRGGFDNALIELARIARSPNGEP